MCTDEGLNHKEAQLSTEKMAKSKGLETSTESSAQIASMSFTIS